MVRHFALSGSFKMFCMILKTVLVSSRNSCSFTELFREESATSISAPSTQVGQVQIRKVQIRRGQAARAARRSGPTTN